MKKNRIELMGLEIRRKGHQYMERFRKKLLAGRGSRVGLNSGATVDLEPRNRQVYPHAGRGLRALCHVLPRRPPRRHRYPGTPQQEKKGAESEEENRRRQMKVKSFKFKSFDEIGERERDRVFLKKIVHDLTLPSL